MEIGASGVHGRVSVHYQLVRVAVSTHSLKDQRLIASLQQKQKPSDVT